MQPESTPAVDVARLAAEVSTVYNEFVFARTFCPRRIAADPTKSSNWTHFTRIAQICANDHVPVREYLVAAFDTYRRIGNLRYPPAKMLNAATLKRARWIWRKRLEETTKDSQRDAIYTAALKPGFFADEWGFVLRQAQTSARNYARMAVEGHDLDVFLKFHAGTMSLWWAATQPWWESRRESVRAAQTRDRLEDFAAADKYARYRAEEIAGACAT